MRQNIQTITADYTLSPFDDVIYIDASSNPINITLPLSSTIPEQTYQFLPVDLTNPVTITPTPPDTIDSLASYTIPDTLSYLTISSTGSNYNILSNNSTWANTNLTTTSNRTHTAQHPVTYNINDNLHLLSGVDGTTDVFQRVSTANGISQVYNLNSGAEFSDLQLLGNQTLLRHQDEATLALGALTMSGDNIVLSNSLGLAESSLNFIGTNNLTLFTTDGTQFSQYFSSTNGAIIQSTNGASSSLLSLDNVNPLSESRTTDGTDTSILRVRPQSIDLIADSYIELGGRVVHTKTETDTTIGNIDDLALNADTSVVFLSGAGTKSLRGVVPNNPAQIQEVTFINTHDANVFNIRHDDTNSTLGNRILVENEADITLREFGSATLIYVPSLTAWVVKSVNRQ